MIIKQLSIFIENRCGRLSEITALLAKKRINIKALSMADTSSFGILRLIVDDAEKVASILNSEEHLTVTATDVIQIGVSDEVGGLNKPLILLTENGIDVEYMYGFPTTNDMGKACMIIRPSDTEKADKILSENGY